MGRRLTPWERQQRDNERKARAAARRAETAARRAKEKKARDKIKAQEKAQKVARTEKEIQVNRSRVALYDSYLLHLEKLHTNYDLNKFESGYKSRLRKRTYKPGNLKEAQKFTKKPYKPVSFKMPSPYKKKPFTMPTYEKSNYKKKEANASVYSTIMAAIGGFVIVGMELVEVGAVIIGGGILLSLIIANSKNSKLKKDYKSERALKKEKHDKKEGQNLKNHQDSIEKNRAKHKEEEAKRKADHEEAEAKRKENFLKKDSTNKKKFEENEEKRISVLKKAEEKKDVESIELILESIFPIDHKLEYPEDFVLGTLNEYELGYNVVDGDNVDLLIALPEIDDIIPVRKISVTPNGQTVRQGELSARARNQLYDKFINSLAFEHAIEVIRSYPFLSNIRLEAFNNIVDPKTGGDAEQIMLKVNFDKDTLLKLNLDRIDPVHAIENFDHSFQSCAKKYKMIDPTINRDEIVWSTLENTGFEIPYGIHPDEKAKSLPS